MQTTVHLKNYRSSARKARLVADLIRGVLVVEARHRLQFSSKKAARAVLKLLESGVANLKDQHQVREEQLQVAEVVVNEGPTLKRMRPASRGRVSPLLKRTCHVKLTLAVVQVDKPVSAKVKKDDK